MKKPIDVKLTKEGFEKIKADYDALLERRPGVVVRLSAAREQGDLSENAGYHAAKEELGNIDRRLREMKLIMRFADIVNSNESDTAGFGSIVSVEQDGKNLDFAIVGKLEADPARGKVSDISPIGSALIGKKAGDVVEVAIPDGVVKFKIIGVKSSG